MPKCVCCEKNITFLKSYYELVEDDKNVVCNDCYNLIFKEMEDSTSIDNFEKGCKKSKSIAEEQVTLEGPKYIDKYIEQKRQKFMGTSNSEDEEQRKIKEKISGHMLTTGFNFEGFKIVDYKQVISGETVLGTGFVSEFSASFSDFFGSSTNMFSNKLKQAKEAALEKLILTSIDIGGNAIIGVDCDYITFTGNLIGVVANGTSVLIKKTAEE